MLFMYHGNTMGGLTRAMMRMNSYTSSDVSWQYYMLWFDNVVYQRPYAVALSVGSAVYAFWDFTFNDDGKMSLYWDNTHLMVNTTHWKVNPDLKYRSSELLQWEKLDPLLQKALNTTSWKSAPHAIEPDRECPFNDLNFQNYFDASYVGPKWK